MGVVLGCGGGEEEVEACATDGLYRILHGEDWVGSGVAFMDMV